jgi:protein-S-isoprenylcysteine O-methyltransferase Ste14
VAAYAILILAGLTGSVSLLLFFLLFLFAGSPDLVDLGLGAMASLVWDTFLSLAFFAQHSGMVRRSYRRWLARYIPPRYHGASHTIASGIVLLMLIVFWQESAHTLVSFEGMARWLLRAVCFLSIAGFAWGVLALRSFDTLGLKPILDYLRGTQSPPAPFAVRGPYRWVRHPLYLFCLLIIWSCPDLTADRLLFNVLWTVWIAIGTVLEERDLLADFGRAYRDYQRAVPMLIPWRVRPTPVTRGRE